MSDKWDLPEGQTQYNPADLQKHSPEHHHKEHTIINHASTATGSTLTSDLPPLKYSEEPDMPGLDEGRVVKFVDHDLSVHAAIIQNVHNKKTGLSTLHTLHKSHGPITKGSVQHHQPNIDHNTGEPDYQPYSWHWPPRV